MAIKRTTVAISKEHHAVLREESQKQSKSLQAIAEEALDNHFSKTIKKEIGARTGKCTDGKFLSALEYLSRPAWRRWTNHIDTDIINYSESEIPLAVLYSIASHYGHITEDQYKTLIIALCDVYRMINFDGETVRKSTDIKYRLSWLIELYKRHAILGTPSNVLAEIVRLSISTEDSDGE